MAPAALALALQTWLWDPEMCSLQWGKAPLGQRDPVAFLDRP